MATGRLPRTSRITRSRDVRRVFDGGRSAAAGPVVVYALDRGDEGAPRYALVVGKKWGAAVERNRVRRRLRESFRLSRGELPQGFDFVLLPRSPVTERSPDELRRDLRSAAGRAAERYRAEGPKTAGRA